MKDFIYDLKNYSILLKNSILIVCIVAFWGHSFIIYNNLFNGDGYYFIDRYGIGLHLIDLHLI